MVGDAAALVAAALTVIGVTAFVATADAGLAAALLGAGLAGLVAIRTQGLWDGHRSCVRSLELAGLVRTAGVIGAGALLIDRLFGFGIPAAAAAGVAVAGLVLLVAWRSALRMWVAANRSRGRFIQRTLIVGTDRRAAELVRLGEIHPEAGAQYVGVVGNRFEAEAAGIAHLWVGETTDLLEVLDASPAIDRLVVCTGALGSLDLATLLDREQQGGPEVVVHAGLPGIDASRITVSAVANEALLRVAPATPSLAGRFLKRAFDIVVAGALLLVAAPVFALVAVLVKREDGGPVLFRQQRVGRDGVGFGMVKFRTMVVDAEARLAADAGRQPALGPTVQARCRPAGHPHRQHPAAHEPRRAAAAAQRPQGRDEPGRAAAGAAAGGRRVPRRAARPPPGPPGITGLWQVEARDNPAFDAYQRLDLFYVANTSFAARRRGPAGHGRADAPAPVPEPAPGRDGRKSGHGRGAVVHRRSLIAGVVRQVSAAQTRERSSGAQPHRVGGVGGGAVGVRGERGVELPAFRQAGEVDGAFGQRGQVGGADRCRLQLDRRAARGRRADRPGSAAAGPSPPPRRRHAAR